MLVWFVIEDALADGHPPQVCTWRLDQDKALADAKALAEAHHDVFYLLVGVNEGQDPLECITPETLCIFHPGRVFDSGRITGGQLLIQPNSDRAALPSEPASPTEI